MKLKSLILRFRDLSTVSGDTIRLHSEIIKGCGKGYVWWGWWNKSNEKIPADTFIHFNKEALNGGLPIMLFDSGTFKLYRTKCYEIRWDSCYNLIPSPQLDITPDYYSKTGYKAWFKLGEIEEVIEGVDEELQKFSYVEVSDFFADSIEHFRNFNNKKVVNREELKYQERTIWFLKEFEKSDLTHLIQLYSEKSTKTEDFILKTIDLEENRLLWLSDLHFSENFHENNNRKLEAFSLKDIINEITEEHGAVGGIISTGDFTNAAKEEEFEAARVFLDNIVQKNSLTPEKIIICPGNHDIKFIPKGPQDFSYAAATEENKKPFSDFYQKVFGKTPNTFLASGRRYLLSNSIPIEIVAINSHSYQQYEGLFRSGVILQSQMTYVEKEMRWNKKQEVKPIRIAILHYNLLPVDFRQDHYKFEGTNVLLDSEEFIRWSIKNQIDVILHGHTHMPFYTRISRMRAFEGSDDKLHDLHIIGMGSSGADSSHLPTLKTNICGLLEFKKDKICAKFIQVFDTGTTTLLKQIEISL